MAKMIVIPPEIEHVFGAVKRPNTRMYYREGTPAEYRVWTEAVFDVTRGAVSPGGASMFGGISRASVHNRMEDGKLTAFFFELKKGVKTGITEGRGNPYIYVPISELKAWAEEIKARGIKKKKLTPEQAEPPKASWVRDFLAWKKKWEKKGTWHALWTL